jgi:hypothetical protein
MKHIIVVLGLIASTGLTVSQVYGQVITASKSSSHQSAHEFQVSLNYEGTNEDGDDEVIETDR